MPPKWDWQHAYKGGDPITLPGFPRPLHWPGQPGYAASVDGPDVEAYKRIVSRLGRWPWQPFDDTFSKAFANGKAGGNVADSGVLGVQRQQPELGETGAVGKGFYDFCRHALIPKGLPHAGEHGMDQTAINQLTQAWKMFGGKEPKPGPAAPLTRKKIASPNYSSRGGATVRLIVVHTAEGATTIESLGSYFQGNVDASSHTGIDDKAGVIGEYVQPGHKAWTASGANPVAVQTELCAFAKWDRAEWNRHPNMLSNCARWIAEEAARFGIPITKLTAAQAQGTGKGVCQHNDLGSWGGGHWDCGSGFPIDDVINMAKGGT